MECNENLTVYNPLLTSDESILSVKIDYSVKPVQNDKYYQQNYEIKIKKININIIVDDSVKTISKNADINLTKSFKSSYLSLPLKERKYLSESSAKRPEKSRKIKKEAKKEVKLEKKQHSLPSYDLEFSQGDGEGARSTIGFNIGTGVGPKTNLDFSFEATGGMIKK